MCTNQGICAHVDLMRFEDGIAIVSMESECVMHFSRADQETSVHEVRCNRGDSQASIPVLLNPGSLILMSGEARYFWKHEINRKAGFQMTILNLVDSICCSAPTIESDSFIWLIGDAN